MFTLPVVLRQGAAAAQRAAGKCKVADLLQICSRDQHAFGLLNLRSFISTSASLDNDDDKPEIPGALDESEQGNILPENATAAEMRQWADRMLGHKAVSRTEDENASLVETLAGSEEPLQPVAGPLQEAEDVLSPEVSGADAASIAEALEVESALPEEYELNVEEGDVLEAAAAVNVPIAHGAHAAADLSAPEPQVDVLEEKEVEEYELNVDEGDVLEAAAAVDVPMEHAHGADVAADVAPPEPQVDVLEEREVVEEDPTEAWVRFVEKNFGQEVHLPTSRARRTAAPEARGTEEDAVPAWRRFMMGDADETRGGDKKSKEATKKQAAEVQSLQLPDFFNMEDPRRELERLLPESARRHGLTQSGFIQPMREDADRANSAAAPVSFKASAPPDAASAAPAQPPPRRVTVVEPPMDRLANAVTGYANLGRPRSERLGAQQDGDSMAAQGRRGNIQDNPRLHPTRMFYPGQTYDPEDLVESGEQIGWRKHVKVSTDKATNGVVRARADFRDQAFLNRFISDLGKLPPKRTTRLQQKTHRHLCRQIKLARQMALLPIDTQLTAEYLERTGAVQKAVSTGVEHNPHMPPPLFDRRMRANGP